MDKRKNEPAARAVVAIIVVAFEDMILCDGEEFIRISEVEGRSVMDRAEQCYCI